MKITSSFQHNENIPLKYSCDGDNINPPITISEIPPETQSIALIVDDPDAPSGTFTHWVVFNIHTGEDNQIEIKEGANPGTNGKNNFSKSGYGGPCPPSGTHHYHFKAYALDTKLDLQEGASRQEVEDAMQQHILQQAEIIGLYSRDN